MRTSVDVHNFLVEREVPHEVVPTRGRLRSAERISSVLDLPPDQVGKVVIFESADPDYFLAHYGVFAGRRWSCYIYPIIYTSD